MGVEWADYWRGIIAAEGDVMEYPHMASTEMHIHVYAAFHVSEGKTDLWWVSVKICMIILPLAASLLIYCQ
jgi:hypothetical protein